MTTAAGHTIQYAVTRGEIWRWYWRAWASPAGLWIYHVSFGLIASWTLFSITRRAIDIRVFVVQTLFFTAICMIVLPLYPLLRFRAGMRTITIGPAGLRTTRGTQSRIYRWQDFRSIRESRDEILITRSGVNHNAFIVPRRAFPDEDARHAFLHDARIWHAARQQE